MPPVLGLAKPDPGDAGKKIKGRKHHILTDTCGFLVFILVHGADIQDRDGAVDVLKAICQRYLSGCETLLAKYKTSFTLALTSSGLLRL